MRTFTYVIQALAVLMAGAGLFLASRYMAEGNYPLVIANVIVFAVNVMIIMVQSRIRRRML